MKIVILLTLSAENGIAGMMEDLVEIGVELVGRLWVVGVTFEAVVVEGEGEVEVILQEVLRSKREFRAEAEKIGN